MFYFIYKTTNNINGKYYIGCHKTANIDDGYMGSGKALLKAIEKYGKHNFTKEILIYCTTIDDMFEKEKEIVNESVVNDENSYNLKIGGSSNFYYVNKNKLNHKTNQHLKHAEKLKNDPEYAKQFSKKMSIANRKKEHKKTEKQKESAKKVMTLLNEKRKNNRNHTVETKVKIAASVKKKMGR